MDCFYDITNYTFSVSGLSGLTLSGGMLDDGSFMLPPGVSNDGTISWTSIVNPLPANYGLLFYIEYDEAAADACFSESMITTSLGFDYAADLGECVELDALSNDNEFIPGEFVLEQPYPNPFNPTVNIPFVVSELSTISIEIYDLNGIKVDQVANNIYSPGTYSVQWRADGFASGTYFVIAKYENESYVQKVVLMK